MPTLRKRTCPLRRIAYEEFVASNAAQAATAEPAAHSPRRRRHRLAGLLQIGAALIAIFTIVEFAAALRLAVDRVAAGSRAQVADFGNRAHARPGSAAGHDRRNGHGGAAVAGGRVARTAQAAAAKLGRALAPGLRLSRKRLYKPVRQLEVRLAAA